MANKKAASSTKKSGVKAKAEPQTHVTTVKAVEAGTPRRMLLGGANPFITRGGGLVRLPIVSAALAEFIGTFLLASTVLIVRNEPFYLFIALVGIFMLVGGLSGAHVNPAVTIGAWVTKRIGAARAIAYLVAQVLAAMLALVVMDAFFKQAPEISAEAAQFGQTAPQLFSAAALPGGKEWTIIFAEIIGVAVLGFAYASALRTVARERLASAFTIGGAAFVAMAFASTAASYVQASSALNPATAITIKALAFDNVWTIAAYIVAPIIGAIIGFFLYDMIRNTEE